MLADQESDLGFTEAVDSSDSESDCVSCSDVEEQEPIQEKLATWSTKNRLTKSSLDGLPGILRSEKLPLPKDARTLLQTPKSVGSEDKYGGKCIYYGLENGISKILSQASAVVLSKLKKIELNINIDGVPLFKSSGMEFGQFFVVLEMLLHSLLHFILEMQNQILLTTSCLIFCTI